MAALKRIGPISPDQFVLGDSVQALNALADRLEDKMDIDPAFISDLQAARAKAETFLQEGLAPYGELLTAIQSSGGDDFLWVRDVTISNSTWGNRAILINGPRDGVHAAGGGIGQSIQMAIGAAIAEPDKQNYLSRGRRWVTSQYRRTSNRHPGRCPDHFDPDEQPGL